MKLDMILDCFVHASKGEGNENFLGAFRTFNEAFNVGATDYLFVH